jgi:ribonuclease HII
MINNKYEIEGVILKENKNWEDILIIGVDEVGRGCLAGPIVGGAVSWNPEFIINCPDLKDLALLLQINDSKKVSPKKRGLLTEFIYSKARATAIHEISADQIDKIGISQANKQVLEQSALKIINANPNKKAYVIVDHFKIFENNPKIKTISVTKGDQKSLSVAAASIIAKTFRDSLMKNAHLEYPQYGFDTNVGYGSIKNIKAIAEYGFSPLHRKTFKIKPDIIPLKI